MKKLQKYIKNIKNLMINIMKKFMLDTIIILKLDQQYH